MKINIKNLNLNYEDVGNSDKIVLLLHGWGANIQTMAPIKNIIKDRYRVISLDLPGFGESDEPELAIDSFEYANIVMEFLARLNIERAIFVGHSFGGKITSIISANHPEMVEKAILIDSAGLIPKRGLDYYIRVYSYKFMKFIYNIIPGKNKEARLEKFRKKHGSDDYNDSSGVMRQILVIVVNENIRPLLNKIQCETLLIWGENDDATPLYMGEIFNEEIKNSGLVVLKDAGHYSYIDDYGTFTRVINSFL